MPDAQPIGAAAATAPETYGFPLSFAQQRLWFLAQFSEANAAYNLPEVWRLRGALNHPALARALQEIITRHDSLRTHFEVIGDEPTQVVVTTATLHLPLTDLSALAPAAQEKALAKLLAEESQRPFNLPTGPLLRLALIQLGPREHVLLRTFHHIISDGWSVGVFNQELSALYRAFSLGNPSPLAPLAIQYPDYTLWQRQWLQGEELARQASYWRTQLAGAPTLELPTDRPRPAQHTYAGASHTFTLDPAVSARLKAFNQAEKVTPFMSLLAAFQVLLARYSGQNDICVGSPIANRQRVELENQIGFFVNTLVLRSQWTPTESFRTAVAQVRKTALDAYEHQDLPFEKLVEELNPERDPSRHPLFQVVLALQNSPAPDLTLADLIVATVPQPASSTHFDLELHFWAKANSWTAHFAYNTDLFDAATIERLAGHFQTLLAALLQQPDAPVWTAPLLTAPEREQLLVTWNATQRDYPRDQGVPELVAEYAARTPTAIALSSGESTLTYHELNTRAEQLAQHLRAAGVGPNDVVALALERSLEQLVAALAILKAGGAYWAVEEKLPAARLQLLLAEAQPRVWLTNQKLQSHFTELLGDARKILPPLLLLEDLLAAPPAPEMAVRAATATSPAYVSFTSGSTGQPKGVVVPHRAVVRLVKNQNYVSLNAAETLLHLSPLSFDASTFEIWGALLNGGRVVIMPPGAPTLADIRDTIQQQGVTTCWLTAGLFHLLADEPLTSLKSLRQLLAGGDVLLPEKVRQVRRALPDCRLINGYGPTENTTFTCCYTVSDDAALTPSVPIGRPIANTQVFVLDAAGQPVPIGVPGELYVGGDGLAVGYLNQPQLTAEKFRPHPFSHQAGARLYRTGDRGRWRPDGALEFLGRLDAQVKLRGYRIELGEIETALLALPEVAAALVCVREDSPGDKRLVAYLVASQAEPPSRTYLRQQLAKHLPDYFIPNFFIWLAQLPLNANGKVDRRALPPPLATGSGAEAEPGAPVNLLELELLRLWQQLFQRADLRRQDNFFALGGHSLLATRLTAEMAKKFGSKIPIATIFQSPTIELLAQRLADEHWAPQWSSLVPLQPHGPQPPLFFVHGYGGDIFGFIDLAKVLPPDQPCYGIQAVGLDGKAPRHITIEQMAAHYVREIISFQPTGGISLVGHSMGGLVAYEIAQQLHLQGRTVALLGLIDTYPIGHVEWRFFIKKMTGHLLRRSWYHLRNWWQLPLANRVKYIQQRWVALNYWINRNRPQLPPITAPLPATEQKPKVAGFDDYYVAVAVAYRVRAYPGAAVYFASDDTNEEWCSYWRDKIRGGATFHHLPGDHLQILLSKTHRPALIQALANALNQRPASEITATASQPKAHAHHLP